jgi:hypothetical protein
MTEKFKKVDFDPFAGVTTPESRVVSADVTGLGIPQLPTPTKETSELSQAGLDFANSFKAFSAYMTTTDPKALQDIVVKNIEGAQPGIDSQGNPYVVIGNKPFYLNKPGLSGADAVGFIGDLIQFAPVAKLSNMFKSGLNRVMTAVGGSGAVSAGKEVGAQLMGSEQGFDAAKVGLDAVFGGVGQKLGDSLTSFIQSRRQVFDANGQYTAEFNKALKDAGININEFGDAGKQAIQTAYQTLGRAFARQAQQATGAARTAEADVFEIPLTRGQATGDVRQMAREEAMRQGGRGGYAQKKMSVFDIAQQEKVKQAITDRLGPTFAPRVGLFTEQQQAGGGLYEMIRSKAGEMKKTASDVYQSIDPQNVRVRAENMGDVETRIYNSLQNSDFIVSPTLTPKTSEMIGQLKSIVPQTEGGKITEVTLKQIEKKRREISNIAKDAAPGSSDANAARNVIKEFDNWLDDAINTGLAKGDAADLDTLKRARSLYRNYASEFKPGSPKASDADAQRAIVKIVQQDLTPTETMNVVFGSSKLGDNQTASRIVSRLKNIFGEGSPEFERIRAAGFSRLFQDSQGNIKPAATIVREIDELTMGKGSAVANELFTKNQIKQLRDFRASVARTVTPAEAKNPSKTGYEIARGLEDLTQALGLGGVIERTLSGDPFGAAASASTMVGARQARPAVQAIQATSPIGLPRPAPSFMLPLGVGVGGLLTPEEELQR